LGKKLKEKNSKMGKTFNPS